MRGAATAAYLLLVTFIGLALGPYTVGFLSVVLGDLRSAMLAVLVVDALALAFAVLAARHLERDESSRLDRAAGREKSSRWSAGARDADARADVVEWTATAPRRGRMAEVLAKGDEQVVVDAPVSPRQPTA